MSPLFSMANPKGGFFFHIDMVPDSRVVAAPYMFAADYLEYKFPMLNVVRDVFIGGVEEAFDSDGPGWADWAPSYEPIAAARNVGGLLERTGAMREGATSRTAYAVTNDDVFFTGAGVPDYWPFAQFGTGPKHKAAAGDESTAEFAARMKKAGFEVDMEKLGAGGGSQPARPFIKMSEETAGKIFDVFDEWVAGAFAGSFVKPGGGVQSRVSGKFGPMINV